MLHRCPSHQTDSVSYYRMIDYNNRQFRTVTNTENGEVSGETRFRYHQEGNLIWAEYAGGSVRKGSIIGTVDTLGQIDMVYQHLNTTGELRTGRCHSVPEIQENGKIRLHETWQWTSGDASSGTSIIEEC